MSNFVHGTVRVSNDIIDRLIAEAALAVDGVHRVVGFRNSRPEKHRREGIVAVVYDGEIKVALTIVVKNGYSVVSVAEAVQKAVAHDLHQMLGLKSAAVNVFVQSLHF